MYKDEHMKKQRAVLKPSWQGAMD